MLSNYSDQLDDLTSDGHEEVIVTLEKNDGSFKTIMYQIEKCENFKCDKNVLKIK